MKPLRWGILGASNFAAHFMGFENIFRLEGADLVSDQGRLPFGSETGASLLAWRPGAVTVGKGPHSGSVIASRFAGDHRDYVIDTPLGPIKADASIDLPEVPLGQQIAFDLPASTARQLAA